MEKQPSSLLDSCIRYVVHNLHLVDSLVDFPDIMGQTLFEAALKAGQFFPLDLEALRRLELFQIAYGELVLGSLSLGDESCFVLETVPLQMKLYTLVVQLDLSSCQLGHHEEHIKTLAQMDNLTHLGLRDNRLTSSTLQLLTAPARVRGRGLVRLQLMDLSCNPCLTDKSMRYLTAFTSLHTLNLSGTGITEPGCSSLAERMGMHVFSGDIGDYDVWNCGISGWATTVLARWLRDYKQKITKPASGARKFYQKTPQDQPRKARDCPPHEPILVLLRAGQKYGRLRRLAIPNRDAQHRRQTGSKEPGKCKPEIARGSKRKMSVSDVISSVLSESATVDSDIDDAIVESDTDSTMVSRKKAKCSNEKSAEQPLNLLTSLNRLDQVASSKPDINTTQRAAEENISPDMAMMLSYL